MKWGAPRKPLPVPGSTCKMERFAYLPTRMKDGTWLWWEPYVQACFFTTRGYWADGELTGSDWFSNGRTPKERA